MHEVTFHIGLRKGGPLPFTASSTNILSLTGDFYLTISHNGKHQRYFYFETPEKLLGNFEKNLSEGDIYVVGPPTFHEDVGSKDKFSFKVSPARADGGWNVTTSRVNSTAIYMYGEVKGHFTFDSHNYPLARLGEAEIRERERLESIIPNGQVFDGKTFTDAKKRRYSNT